MCQISAKDKAGKQQRREAIAFVAGFSSTSGVLGTECFPQDSMSGPYFFVLGTK